tara:strand:- start:190 stop:441 length:252 start_codon:yes stop_codon:yes gene_type:complete
MDITVKKLNKLIGYFWSECYEKVVDKNNPTENEIYDLFWCVTAIANLGNMVDDDADINHKVLHVLRTWSTLHKNYTCNLQQNS